MSDGNPPRGFISISNEDVYRKLERMDDKLNTLSRNFDHVTSDTDDLKRKVRALELRFYGILAGLIAATGSIFVGVKVGH